VLVRVGQEVQEVPRSLRLGVFLAAQYPAGNDAAAGIAEHVEQVALARELGFSSVMAGQHFLSDPYQMAQPIPLLARMAAEADGMAIGPGILLLPLLNPLQVAEEIATLDAVTGGRAILGVGIGYRPIELAGFGVADRPARVFEAKLDVVRRLLAGEEVTASGPGYALEGARLTLVPPRPVPVWVAANRDAAVRRAARVGDAWLMNPHTTLGELARQHELYGEARTAAGLPAPEEVPALREVCVAETDEEAMLVAGRYLQGKYAAYVQWGQSDVMPDGDTLRRAWEELTAGGRFIIGSPQTCGRLLREHAEQAGVTHLVGRMQWPGMEQEHVLRSMRLLVEEALPASGLTLDRPR
jgi:alkanesulfonate monooxygenase SsuD/methylene tetrahydromethanopterin reductase-like flavin-dependent oxidoreductase (luciferase family)